MPFETHVDAETQAWLQLDQGAPVHQRPYQYVPSMSHYRKLHEHHAEYLQEKEERTEHLSRIQASAKSGNSHKIARGPDHYSFSHGATDKSADISESFEGEETVESAESSFVSKGDGSVNPQNLNKGSFRLATKVAPLTDHRSFLYGIWMHMKFHYEIVFCHPVHE